MWGLESVKTIRADVLHHARSRATGANVHSVLSTIQAYVFACEDLQQIQDVSLQIPKSPAVRQRLMRARADVERMESELWAM